MQERHYPGEVGDVPTFEEAPLQRAEYISALVHFYRGELDRSTQWRMRLDTTTNWSIFSVMGLVTFSLGDSTHSHAGILAGMGLVLTFLGIEARRFRFFDVWRARTRMLEENFIGPILRRDLISPVASWGKLVAEDLLTPKFKMTYLQALRARLLRNYVPLFLILGISWVLKLSMPLPTDTGPRPFLRHMEIGVLPWWVSLVFVLLLYGYLIGVAIFAQQVESPEEGYWGGKQKQERVPQHDI